MLRPNVALQSLASTCTSWVKPVFRPLRLPRSSPEPWTWRKLRLNLQSWVKPVFTATSWDKPVFGPLGLPRSSPEPWTWRKLRLDLQSWVKPVFTAGKITTTIVGQTRIHRWQNNNDKKRTESYAAAGGRYAVKANLGASPYSRPALHLIQSSSMEMILHLFNAPSCSGDNRFLLCGCRMLLTHLPSGLRCLGRLPCCARYTSTAASWPHQAASSTAVASARHVQWGNFSSARCFRKQSLSRSPRQLLMNLPAWTCSDSHCPGSLPSSEMLLSNPLSCSWKLRSAKHARSHSLQKSSNCWQGLHVQL